jgi:hypothetical protein
MLILPQNVRLASHGLLLSAERSHISCAAVVDRENNRVISRFQNGCDLGAAKRRQLHVVVGRQYQISFTFDRKYGPNVS